MWGRYFIVSKTKKKQKTTRRNAAFTFNNRKNYNGKNTRAASNLAWASHTKLKNRRENFNHISMYYTSNPLITDFWSHSQATSKVFLFWSLVPPDIKSTFQRNTPCCTLWPCMPIFKGSHVQSPKPRPHVLCSCLTGGKPHFFLPTHGPHYPWRFKSLFWWTLRPENPALYLRSGYCLRLYHYNQPLEFRLLYTAWPGC